MIHCSGIKTFFNVYTHMYIPWFNTLHLEWSHYTQPTLKEWELCSPSCSVEHLRNLFGILLHRIFVSFLLFVYSVIYLYLHGLRDVSFILWIITQYSINYFLSELFYLSSVKSLAGGSLIPLTCPILKNLSFLFDPRCYRLTVYLPGFTVELVGFDF